MRPKANMHICDFEILKINYPTFKLTYKPVKKSENN